MPRNSKEQEAKRRVKVAYYKWEFLRRNEFYHKDYRELMALHGKALKKAHYPGRAYSADSLNSELRRLLGGLHFRWRVNFMQNPKRWVALDVLEKEMPIPGKATVSRKKRLRIEDNPFWETPEFSILDNATVLEHDVAQFNGLSIDLRQTWEWVPLLVNLTARPEALKEQFAAVLEKVRTEKRPNTDDAPISLEANELKSGSKKKLNFETYLKVWDVMRKLGATGRVEGNRWVAFTPNSKSSGEKTTFMKLVEAAEKKAAAKKCFQRPQGMESDAADIGLFDPTRKMKSIFRSSYEDRVIAGKMGWISDFDRAYLERDAIDRAHRAIQQAVMLIVERGYLRIS